jgi:hypothetical protein
MAVFLPISRFIIRVGLIVHLLQFLADFVLGPDWKLVAVCEGQSLLAASAAVL